MGVRQNNKKWVCLNHSLIQTGFPTGWGKIRLSLDICRYLLPESRVSAPQIHSSIRFFCGKNYTYWNLFSNLTEEGVGEMWTLFCKMRASGSVANGELACIEDSKGGSVGENLPTSVKMHGSFSLVRPDSIRLLILLAWCGRWNLARCYKSVKSWEPMQKGAAL